MQAQKGHVVKVFLPADLHHAMRVLLVSRRTTWEGWVRSKAEEEVEGADWEDENEEQD